jgi:hypothetical protein
MAASPPRPDGLPRAPPRWAQPPIAGQALVIHLLAVSRPPEARRRALAARLAALAAQRQRHSGHSARPPRLPPGCHRHRLARRRAPPGQRQVLVAPTEGTAGQPPACGGGPTVGPAARPCATHQGSELPGLRMRGRPFGVSEARGSRGGRVTNAPGPPAAAAGHGPRGTALRGELAGRQRRRRGAVQACGRAAWGGPSSPGALHRAGARGAAALSPPDEAMTVPARRAPVKDLDEPRWDQHGGGRGGG